MTHRFAIFGDVGGWFKPFAEALVKIGVDPDSKLLPDDLTVIQLGDLVHRGPHSSQCVQLANGFMASNKHRDVPAWIQLWGNHEGHHIGGPQFGEPQTMEPYELDARTENVLKQWSYQQKAQVAVALKTDQYGDLLCVHGGLTWFFWQQYVRAETARSVALSLNEMGIDLQFKPGIMLGERGMAGPVWAEAAGEVYHSWNNRLMPFSQVHGHSSAFYWHGGRFSKHVSPEIAARMQIDQDMHHEHFISGGKRIIGIDPCFGKHEPYYEITPLIVTGELL